MSASVSTPSSGRIALTVLERSGSLAAILRASLTPSTIDSMSSSSDSELVRMRGLASGSGEASSTQPRALGVSSVGAIV
jgi:hypothetical protein